MVVAAACRGGGLQGLVVGGGCLQRGVGGGGSNCFLGGVSDERAATGRSFPAVRGGRARGADCKIKLQREQEREQKRE